MSETAVRLDLRGMVRRVLDSGLVDPGLVADEVLADIPDEALREALGFTLRAFVRQSMAGQRNVGAAFARPTPGASWKGSAIRDGWQRTLLAAIHVGDGYKALAACTYADLVFAADERSQIAERNAAQSRRYRAYAIAVAEAEVGTFGELPTEAQMHLLGGTS